MDKTNQLPETGFIRLKHVLKIVPVGKSTWWAGVKDGRYPQPVKLGPRVTAWRVEDIKAFIEGFNTEKQDYARCIMGKRLYPLQRIKAWYCYDIEEICSLYKSQRLHQQTVRQWIKNGLPIID
ncbi:MAG: AlpA family phage regulatory protein, partial [Bacteroidetes bacterium]|nr:AlpA family phage regulatory protein [Bacteroidota bacterium]